jgi:hypothetical protein
MEFEKEENENQCPGSPPRFVDLDEIHNSNCQKQPSSCRCCEETAWIWASSPVQVECVRGGMWILSLGKKNVDTIWSEIKTHLSKNQLGNLAKVSINRRGDMHFICLYTSDFRDVPDVFRVLVTLRRMNHIENDFLEYVTEVHDVEEAVNGEDFKKRIYETSEKAIVKIYVSPPVSNDGAIEYIEMYLRKISPESKVGLVAELRKSVLIESKDIINFYNPPIDMPMTSSESRPCKYDELVDYEDDCHKLNCDKQPSTCNCEDVDWIWANQLVQVKPIHSGKWLLFPDKTNVDEIWEKVKILIAANRLGNGAKVSKGETRNQSVICVYTENFEDVQDVFRVLVTLQRNRLQNTAIHYKTDEATLQGLYKTDEAAKRAGFDSTEKLKPGQRVSMYFSPPSTTVSTGATEFIQLFLNNIGPEFKRGLVAELRKEPHDLEDKIIVYNPPRIQQPSDRSSDFVPKSF